jgi:hypothetical protein
MNRLYWDQFCDFDSFSRYISSSGQISANYFVFNSLEIQQKVNIQFFIQSKNDKFPIILPSIDYLLSVPISRPMQLLTHKSYLDSLVASYFKNLHTVIPLFSIHSFNPKTVSKPLLSTIYYGGFLFMSNKPYELLNYFDRYVAKRIKEASKNISIQSVISIFIYSFLLLISGKLTLSRTYQVQAIRMIYALGLHLKPGRLGHVQKYDRMILLTTLSTVHIGACGTENLYLNMLGEFGEFNIDCISPQYQIPTPDCAFYFDTDKENILYGLCINMRSKYFYKLSLYTWSLSKCKEDYAQKEFDKYFKKVTKSYLQAKKFVNQLSLKFPHFNSKIQKHSLQMHLDFSNVKLELYRILEVKKSELKPCQISNMISEGCLILDLVIGSKELNQVYDIYAYIAGLSFVRINSKSCSNQRKLIKAKLTQLLDYLSCRVCTDKLSFLIIKNEYEKIMKS